MSEGTTSCLLDVVLLEGLLENRRDTVNALVLLEQMESCRKDAVTRQGTRIAAEDSEQRLPSGKGQQKHR